MSDFWSDNEDAVVMRAVRAIAVYTNECGDIVIRQQGDFDEEDAIIVVPSTLAGLLLGAIKAEIEIK